MKTLIRSELAKLRTLRSTWVVVAASILVSAGITVAVLAIVKHLTDAPAQIAGAALGVPALIVGIMCSQALAAEYHDGTIATTFTLVPARGRVVLAKAAAAAIIGILVAAIAAAVSFAIAAEWLHRSGAAWPWTAAELIRATLGSLAIGATVAVAGVGIGAVARTPAVAGTAVGLIWIGISNLLAGFLPFFRHYGMAAAQTALTQPTAHHYYSFVGALAVTLGVSAGFLAAGLRRVQLTDI